MEAISLAYHKVWKPVLSSEIHLPIPLKLTVLSLLFDPITNKMWKWLMDLEGSCWVGDAVQMYWAYGQTVVCQKISGIYLHKTTNCWMDNHVSYLCHRLETSQFHSYMLCFIVSVGGWWDSCRYPSPWSWQTTEVSLMKKTWLLSHQPANGHIRNLTVIWTASLYSVGIRTRIITLFT